MTHDNIQIEFHERADEKRFRNRLRNPFIRAKEEKLAKRVAGLVPVGGRLLEVGCGEGSNLFYLQKALPGCRLVGVDFSQEKIRFLSKNLSGVEAHCADARDLLLMIIHLISFFFETSCITWIMRGKLL